MEKFSLLGIAALIATLVYYVFFAAAQDNKREREKTSAPKNGAPSVTPRRPR